MTWKSVAWMVFVLLLVRQEPVIWRQKDFFESLDYYALTPLTEYPTVATWPLKLFGDHVQVGFVVLLVVVQAAILWACVFFERREAAALWLALIAAMGPLMLSRMDLLPAAAVALCAVLLVSFPATAAVVLAVATAMKLWPGLVAACLLGSWRRVGGFVLGFAALVGASVAIHGVERTVSPVLYQQDRGLQIESVFGAPLLLRADTHVDFAPSMSYEVFGGGVGAMLVVATAAQVAVVLLAAGLGLLTAMRWSHETALACAMSIVWLVIVTNKVFSPQYVIWVLPLAVVVAAVSVCRVAHVVAWLCVPLVVLTGLVYPLMYDEILLQQPAAVWVLNARNIAVVVLAGLSLWWWVLAWRAAQPTGGWASWRAR
ncbi:glycosyltransferase 87 family protein [Corynebacterium aquilae]|uniref:glycosyltransferase 87 family protein n=1 Tax=Corynebacterium aquilae TaxID=203263 RepID=UPI00147517A5|nr:glycosyltransferase 87 family protein [Corynebacterium aquilae]